MFEIGTRVAWSHAIATQHAEGSIVRIDAIRAADPEVRFGVISKVDVAADVAEGETPTPAVGRKNVFEVTLDAKEGEEAEVRELTADELVKVAA